MCGIYGCIGKIDYSILRALAIANISRGKDSMGYFDNTDNWIKCAGNPMDLLATDDFNNWFLLEDRKWIVGHNRHGTRGLATTENAHPFVYGKIIGSHNGIVYDAPQGYEVDSEYLFDLLDLTENDYQDALGDVGGYWGLAWSYGGELFLQAHNNTIALVRVGETYYFSSDADHLKACVGKYDELIILNNGLTIKFDKDNKLVDMPTFISTVPKLEPKNKYVSSGTYLGYTYNAPREEKYEDISGGKQTYGQCRECLSWMQMDRLIRRNGALICDECLDFELLHPEYTTHDRKEANEDYIYEDITSDTPQGDYCDNCGEMFKESDITYRNQMAYCPRCLHDAIDLEYDISSI